MRELTDAEILDRFSGLFAEASYAMRADPEVIIRMGEAAARLRQGKRPARPYRASKRPPVSRVRTRSATTTSKPTGLSARSRRPNQRLTLEEREARDAMMRQMQSDGHNLAEIAAEAGLTPSGAAYVLRSL